MGENGAKMKKKHKRLKALPALKAHPVSLGTKDAEIFSPGSPDTNSIYKQFLQYMSV